MGSNLFEDLSVANLVLGKAHVGSFPNIAFETVPVFV